MKNLISNTWKDASDGQKLEVYNPLNNQLIDYIPESKQDDINEAVWEGNKAFLRWRDFDQYERSNILLKFVLEVRRDYDSLVKQLVEETGKPVREARKELDFLISTTVSLVEDANHLHLPVIPSGYEKESKNTTKIYKRYPIGLVAVLLPSYESVINFALKVIPPVLMGNSVIIKPSPYAPLTVTKLAYLLRKAGTITGAVQLLNGTGDFGGKFLLSHPDLALISYTGNTITGLNVMANSYKNMIRVVADLGSDDYSLILPDANLEDACYEIVRDRFTNSGLNTKGTRKILVHKMIKDEFVNQLILETNNVKIGLPDEEVDITCLGSKFNSSNVDKAVRALIGQGAKLLLGGNKKENTYEPTIITNVDKDTKGLNTLQILGPVLILMEYDSIDEAIKIINNSPYGTATSLYTENLNKAFIISDKIDVGKVVVNGGTSKITPSSIVKGWKYSSLGESSSLSILEGYTQLKLLVLNEVMKDK